MGGLEPPTTPLRGPLYQIETYIFIPKRDRGILWPPSSLEPTPGFEPGTSSLPWRRSGLLSYDGMT